MKHFLIISLILSFYEKLSGLGFGLDVQDRQDKGSDLLLKAFAVWEECRQENR